MKKSVKNFIRRVREEGCLKQESVVYSGFGRKREFLGYDWGSDTFIFENNIWNNLENHSPVLVVRKSDIRKKEEGYIFTLSSGNHGVTLLPLLSGEFWDIPAVSEKRRQKIISKYILCANVVKGSLELSQREVATSRVVEIDKWLRSFGFDLNEIVFSDRNLETLDFYRRIGQEWRIRPLAWNLDEMKTAVFHSRTRINSKLEYYHSSAGVHFLSYQGLKKLLDIFEDNYTEFVLALKELVFTYTGQHVCNMRLHKRNNHHEIELFGLRMGTAEKMIIPELENFMDAVIHKRLDADQIRTKLLSVFHICEQSLESPELADSQSRKFIETMYIHLSGEIYQLDAGVGSTAFDARRVALPGATYKGSRPDFHSSADSRTRILIQNVEQLLSYKEQIEYVNVYELRNGESSAVGRAGTREIIYKTNRRPLTVGLIEKKLAHRKIGYGSYLLARVQAFKMLGIDVGNYRLITRAAARGRGLVNFFLRDKSPGEPLRYIKPAILKPELMDEENAAQIREFVLALCSLLGNAAAQNLVMKKYISRSGSCRFGEGKEIYETGFDVQSGREIPLRVKFCSVRGALGWRNTACTEDNLESIFDFYLTNFADKLLEFSREYRSVVPLTDCVNRFFTGFECKTREMFWIYAANRDDFDNFKPKLASTYAFTKKWKFLLWALEKQYERVDQLHSEFIEKINA
ncbi:MAG: hypothetical protein R6V06_10680 [Kiritimatiellia bacterium]